MRFSYTLLKKLIPKIKNQEQLKEALELHAFEVNFVKDDIIDISIPANRYSDAGSHLGMARIISAIFNTALKEPKFAKLKKSAISKKLKIKISDPKHCLRYSGLYVEIPEIQFSSQWLQNILISCGLRPINNVVDIMNYAMLEIGQPIHAFDRDLIAGGINIRLAENNEKFISLDKEEYRLNNQDLVIADDKEVLAIAGIKGGKTAEVNFHTRRLIIESANFDSAGIYRTSRRLNLFTDASARFGHGLSPVLVERALARVAQLLKEICNAKIGDWLDVNDNKFSKRFIKFNIKKFNKLTGLNLNEKICLDYLKRLGFKIKDKLIEVPPERVDIEIFEDLIEEIINLYGYDKLPASAPVIVLKPSGSEDLINFKEKIRNILINFGLDEVYNYSFINGGDLNNLRKYAIKIENPVSAEFAYLCPNLSLQLLKNADLNLKFRNQIKIFEIGKVFKKTSRGKTLKFEENLNLGLLIASKKEGSFLELKGIIEQLLKQSGLTSFIFINIDKQNLKIKSDDEELGYIRLIINKAVAEIDLQKFLRLVVEEKNYEPISKYPSVMRDISFFVSGNVLVGEILAAIQRAASKFLDDVDLLDFYVPSTDIQENRKSLTFRLVFQAKDHTLTDKEINQEIEKIISVLQNKFRAEIR